MIDPARVNLLLDPDIDPTDKIISPDDWEDGAEVDEKISPVRNEIDPLFDSDPTELIKTDPDDPDNDEPPDNFNKPPVDCSENPPLIETEPPLFIWLPSIPPIILMSPAIPSLPCPALTIMDPPICPFPLSMRTSPPSYSVPSPARIRTSPPFFPELPERFKSDTLSFDDKFSPTSRDIVFEDEPWYDCPVFNIIEPELVNESEVSILILPVLSNIEDPEAILIEEDDWLPTRVSIFNFDELNISIPPPFETLSFAVLVTIVILPPLFAEPNVEINTFPLISELFPGIKIISPTVPISEFPVCNKICPVSSTWEFDVRILTCPVKPCKDSAEDKSNEPLEPIELEPEDKLTIPPEPSWLNPARKFKEPAVPKGPRLIPPSIFTEPPNSLPSPLVI